MQPLPPSADQAFAGTRLVIAARKPRQPRSERSGAVEIDAGRDQRASDVGIARDAAQHLAQVDVAVRLDRGLASAGSARLAGSLITRTPRTASPASAA